MDIFFQQIITLLLEPPGNLVYYLVLAFSVAGAFAGALNVWRTSGLPEGRRMVIDLGILLVLRLVLFFLVGLAWQGILNQRVLIPVLDRGVSLLSIVLIAWMWMFPRPSRAGDAATLLLALIVISLGTLSLVWWSAQDTQMSYNGSWPDLAAVMLSVAVTTCGCLMLILRRPVGWGFGLGMLGILLVGDVAYLTFPYPQGDYSGVVRLAQLVAYPLLLLLPGRISVEEEAPSGSLPPAAGGKPALEEKDLLRADWYQSLFNLGVETDPENIYLAIAKTVSHKWTADLCLILSAPGPHGNMSILCGYDLIREQTMGGGSINSQSIPVIASAMRRDRSLRLPASSTSPDLLGLEQLLDIRQIGHLLAAPVTDRDGVLQAGIILITPYTKHAWTADDQLRLTDYAKSLARVLQHSRMITSMRTDLEKANLELQTSKAEAQRANQDNETLLARLGVAPSDESDRQIQIAGLAALIAAHEEAQHTIDQLRAENSRLLQIPPDQIQAAEAPSYSLLHTVEKQGSDETSYVEGELRLALEEVARLKMTLSEADRKLLDLRRELSVVSPSGVKVKEIVSLAQEVRQPMTSIVGYTDFLLGESIGILGTLQRRFLERIRSAADRMRKLVDDLIVLAGEETSLPEAALQIFDLSTVIDDAIARTGSSMRDHNIALRMDLPENLPALRTDRNTLEQLLVILLENAEQVTPVDGEITLRVNKKSDGGLQDYVLIQVADQGGGIAPQYLPEVFSEKPVEKREPIPGLGGNIHELTYAKTLAESLGGRIWVDSDQGFGATFSMLFPVAMMAPGDDSGGGARG